MKTPVCGMESRKDATVTNSRGRRSVSATTPEICRARANDVVANAIIERRYCFRLMVVGLSFGVL